MSLYPKLKLDRMNAKHTGDSAKANGLKLPLNCYSGALRATFNPLYDPLQGTSMCISGQCVLLILISDLRKVPTLKMVASNTDAVMFEIDEDRVPEVEEILHSWEKRYRLELERDDVLKLVMKDINNYCDIVQTSNGKVVNFKGGYFAGCPKVIINEDGTLTTKVKTDFKANSLTIVAEALLKYLLFNIPIEETINNCDDIFRFQMINKCGGSYIKLVQESPNGDIELQRTNRIYAGKTKSGIIMKIKADGRRDSLPSCPDNPLIDNDNHCSIDEINKKWYMDLANQRVSDFLGLGKHIMKGRQKLMKKDELIEANKDLTEKLEKSIEQNEKLIEKMKKMNTTDTAIVSTTIKKKEGEIMENNLHKKIVKFRELVRNKNFILDAELPKNLGGGEYYSIDQYYDAVQELSMEAGLDFAYEVVDLVRFDAELFKPANGSPQHVATVRAVATFTDIDSGECRKYTILGSGSDSIDKSIGGASTMAFRNWFKYNFTPKGANDTEDKVVETPKSVETKPKAFIPEAKKAELVTKTIENGQVEKQDDDKIKGIVENIMKIRTIKNDQTYGASTLQNLMSGTLTSPEIMQIQLTIEDRLEELGAK